MRPSYNILLEINADLNQGRYLDDNILDELIESRGDWVLGEIVFLLNAELEENNFLQIALATSMRKFPRDRARVDRASGGGIKALVNRGGGRWSRR